MKKIIAIALIALILMNVMGYYGVFIGLQIKNDVAMKTRLDLDDFSPSQIVTIEIPLTLPYGAAASDFERVDGTFTHKGEVYRLLKQKVFNDVLTIQCVKDSEARKIQLALAEYVKTFADDQSSSTQGKTVFTFIKDYLPESISIGQLSGWWNVDLIRNSSTKVFISSFVSNIVHPPER